MKRITLFLISLSLLLFFSPAVLGQQAVKEATKEAEKLNKKITKRHFKKFKTEYKKALWAMSVIEKNAASNPFGYDQLADAIPDWIKLNDILEMFPDGVISCKGKTIPLQVKDYRPLLKEARAKAAAAHMKAALQIIHSTTDFTQRQKALEHFALAKKYSNAYQNEINHESAAIYYEEGMRIYKMYPDFSHRFKAVYYFDKANTFIPNYNNSNPMLASLFYQKGAQLASSRQLNDLMDAKKYLSKTIQYVPDYKNTAALLKEVNIKGAWLLYQAAKAKETEGTFQSEAEAANLYKQADQWIPGYLDAAARAQKAERCSVAEVIVINPNGKAIEPYELSGIISRDTPPYIHFPRLTNAMTNINLNYPDNYPLFARRLGNGFILIKLNKDEKNPPEFIRTAPKTSIGRYVTYTQQVMKDGKPVTETITESQYNQLKAQNVKGLSKHEGYVKTILTQTLLMTNERIEIWDVRKPEHPVMLGMIALPSRIRSTQKQVSVYGDKTALPGNIRTGTFGHLKTKQELLEEFKEEGILPYLNEYSEHLLKILNNEITFRRL
ncbi:hypothetical protein LA303_05260 [Candidatus Sulfidibacterium hydrothermale]|uniref:hypothetical protein n=1 Tax=Candidatus Sulfidibacterium hydrothermale TaxID=2875962 RepID=UPI001F0B619F|nr:hypothetical protein [Candidatus Sulfidibacterium hydrothermale]UBM63375.1 hypothetical protein LA303_05260 [Candidatus Sulfidibacterium hydrothermale]